MKKVVLVIPTYNESGNIETLIKSIDQHIKEILNWQIEVVIVDSSSPDGTSHLVTSLQKQYTWLHLITTPKEGLGRAYIKGFNYAMEYLNPYLLFEMDADLSHDPTKIKEFLATIQSGADFVIGSRYIPGGAIPKDWGWNRKLLSILGNIIIKLGFMKLKITDWTSGYRAIKVWVVKKVLPHAEEYSGYVFQVALLDRALINGAVIKEVPIQFVDRTQGESKINSAQYTLQTLLYVFTHSSFVKFVFVGLSGFTIDVILFYLFFSRFHISKPVATILSAEIALVSNFLLNNFWSFRHKKISGGLIGYVVKFVTFNLVSSGSVIIQWLGMVITLRFIGDFNLRIANLWNINSSILYKICIIAFLVIPYSYIMYNKFVWKEK